MKKNDARSLSPTAQEALRRQAVKAVHQGLSHVAAAKLFGVCRHTIDRWIGKYETGGSRALAARKQGRPLGKAITPTQAKPILKAIINHCPDQLKLPFALWTREAVAELIEREQGQRLSVWTIGRYLRDWGMTPQKPIRKAYEQNPKAVKQWLQTEYPAIKRAAQRTKAAIHWVDEMGLRSDHQVGRSYGRKGKTPVIPGTGKRFKCNMISTVTNRGDLRFMIFTKRFTVPVFVQFLERLIKDLKQPVVLIADGHPVHKSKALERWIKKHRKQIRLFFLPTYSPELNPDELLNNDVKSNAVGRNRPADLPEMLQTVRGYLRGRQRNPRLVKRYFQKDTVRYAA
jgi:transposase